MPYILRSAVLILVLVLTPVARGAGNDFTIIDPDETSKPDPARPKPARKYDTFAHHVLDLDSEEAPASPSKYARLDAIIDDARSRITYDATLTSPAAKRKQAE